MGIGSPGSLAAVCGDLDERHDAGGKPRREAGRSGRGACDKDARDDVFYALFSLVVSFSESFAPSLCVCRDADEENFITLGY